MGLLLEKLVGLTYTGGAGGRKREAVQGGKNQMGAGKSSGISTDRLMMQNRRMRVALNTIAHLDSEEVQFKRAWLDEDTNLAMMEHARRLALDAIE